MKSLLVSMLLFAFVQGAQAAPVLLNEGHSKKLYNVLAAYGLRTPFPAEKLTREWANPVICQKTMNGVATYTCLLHDRHHDMDVQKYGLVAKKLYYILRDINGVVCEGPKCFTRSPDIKCIHWWPNKHNPPESRYLCAVERVVPD